jgi:hypothetical protein
MAALPPTMVGEVEGYIKVRPVQGTGTALGPCSYVVLRDSDDPVRGVLRADELLHIRPCFESEVIDGVVWSGGVHLGQHRVDHHPDLANRVGLSLEVTLATLPDRVPAVGIPTRLAHLGYPGMP